MRDVFFLTGSNLGNRLRNIQSALEIIQLRIGNIKCSSHIYETEPWGYISKNIFYNQCLQVATGIIPEEIMEIIREIEFDAGRKEHNENYSDRRLDIDVLFYGNEIISTEKIEIPHPRVHLRRFALTAMAEIAPQYVHPVFKMTISRLLENCEDKGKISILDF